MTKMTDTKTIEIPYPVIIRIKKPSQAQIEAAAKAMQEQYLKGSHWHDLAEAALTAIMQKKKSKLRRRKDK